MVELQAMWVAKDLRAQEPAQLQLLSAHKHVANFAVEGQTQLLMIGDPSVYPGPCSVGLSYEGYRDLSGTLESTRTGQVEEGKIRLQSAAGEQSIVLGDFALDFSVPTDLAWEPHILRKSIKAASDLLVEKSSSLSNLLLTNDRQNRENDLTGSLHERFSLAAFREHVPVLIGSIVSGDESAFMGALSRLVGLGPGSTPSGDDLIHGALVAYQYAKAAQGKAQEVPVIPGELIRQTTLLGRHMLTIGQQGLTPQPIRDFLIGLFRGQVNETAIARAGEIGASTGWDIVTAALLMLDYERREGIGSTSIC